MLPGKHVEELEQRQKLRKRLSQVLPLTAFVLTFFLFAPFLHELSHIAVLFFEGCRSSVEWGIGPTGLRAEVNPLCTQGMAKNTFFYLSGYMSSLAVGGAFLIASDYSSLKDKCLKVLGIAFLLSIVATGTYEGDFFLLGSIWSLQPGLMQGFLIAFSLVVSMVVLMELAKMWDQNGSMDDSTKP